MVVQARQTQLAASFLERAAEALRESRGTSAAAALRTVVEEQPAGRAALAAALEVMLESDPGLALVAPTINELLRAALAADALGDAVAGEPSLLDSEETWGAEDPLIVGRVRGEAQHRVFEHPLLSASEFGHQSGSTAKNPRERVRQMRARGEVVGVPYRGSFVYPAFQIDAEHRRVWPTVREINAILDALRDPWGAASWWFSTDAQLGVEPCSLVGNETRADDLRTAARLAVAPIV